MNRHSRQFLIYAVLIEGGLLSIALFWKYFQDISWKSKLTPTFLSLGIGIGAGLALLLVNYLVVEYGSRHVRFFKIIKQLIQQDVSPLFQNIHLGVVTVIAILSGFAEELFFRGVLQSQIGLVLSSVIFGLAHIWKRTAIPYGIYAMLIGVYFSGLYLWTGNLWVPIIAHGTNNFATILYYMRVTAPTSNPVIISEKV